MGFQVDTRGVPLLGSYDKALDAWRKTKPWRGSYENDARPLAERRKKHMRIHYNASSGRVRCTLYRTDVVKFDPDGSIWVTGYSSRSTEAFAHAVLAGSGADVSFNKGFFLVILPQGVFSVPNTVHLIPAREDGAAVRNDDSDLRSAARKWTIDPETPAQPFVRHTVNRKRARAALMKRGFYDFVAWIRAAAAMHGVHDRVGWGRHTYLGISSHELMELFDGPRGLWIEIAKKAKTTEQMNLVIDTIRKMIYHGEDVFDKVDVDHLDYDNWYVQVRSVS